MIRRVPSPAGAVSRGLLAGVIGTAMMTGYQLAVAKARGSDSSDTPAEVAKRVIGGVFRRRVPDDDSGVLNNATHFAYGTAWGVPYGIAQSTLRAPFLRQGAFFGGLVWAASLLELPAMKLAPPVWEYPPAELVLDASYHLVYGLSVAAAYHLLDRE